MTANSGGIDWMMATDEEVVRAAKPGCFLGSGTGWIWFGGNIHYCLGETWKIARRHPEVVAFERDNNPAYSLNWTKSTEGLPHVAPTPNHPEGQEVALPAKRMTLRGSMADWPMVPFDPGDEVVHACDYDAVVAELSALRASAGEGFEKWWEEHRTAIYSDQKYQAQCIWTAALFSRPATAQEVADSDAVRDDMDKRIAEAKREFGRELLEAIGKEPIFPGSITEAALKSANKAGLESSLRAAALCEREANRSAILAKIAALGDEVKP
jgi:hypothetical protein